jgi:hypothetical protein
MSDSNGRLGVRQFSAGGSSGLGNGIRWPEVQFASVGGTAVILASAPLFQPSALKQKSRTHKSTRLRLEG